MNIPRVLLANLPTPLQPLQRLSAHLNGPQIWIKRDDEAGFSFGGNKVRKLEFLLAEAQANGARSLVTMGAVQSNHCRVVAAAAARFNLECQLVMYGDLSVAADGNFLADQLYGAKIHASERSNREEKLKFVFDQAWSDGKRPFLIPLGGSTATGALGYTFAMGELKKQDDDFDWIVTATSSCGTLAGLTLGKRLHDFKGKVLAISIDETKESIQQKTAALAEEASERFGPRLNFDPEEVQVDCNYLSKGYGIPSPGELAAIRLFAGQEGILLDPVYTCRAAAGMIDLIHKGFFGMDKRILFWHTGGIPALFSRRYCELLADPYQ